MNIKNSWIFCFYSKRPTYDQRTIITYLNNAVIKFNNYVQYNNSIGIRTFRWSPFYQNPFRRSHFTEINFRQSVISSNSHFAEWIFFFFYNKRTYISAEWTFWNHFAEWTISPKQLYFSIFFFFKTRINLQLSNHDK